MTSTSAKRLIPEHLCARCGACVPACPHDVLAVDDGLFPYYARESACTQCRRCLAVCPGVAVDFRVPTTDGMVMHPLLGAYRAVYHACSRDTAIRDRASSGGAVTALLAHGLRTGAFDAVLAVTMRPGDLTRAAYALLTDPAEAECSGQAKYQITHLAEVLPEIRRHGRVAVVGLPCHIHALRKFEALEPNLGRRIVVRLGTFCNGVCEREGTLFLLRRLGVRPEQVRRLEYRHGPWPGVLRVEHDGGAPVEIRRDVYGALLYLYLAERCLYCIDLTAEQADLSFGDAKWANARGNGRWSHLIVRTQSGGEFLDRIGNCLELRSAVPADIVREQAYQFDFKKRRAFLRLRFRRPAPEYALVEPPVQSGGRLREALFMLAYRSRRPARWILAAVPRALLWEMSRRLFGSIRRRHPAGLAGVNSPVGPASPGGQAGT